MLSEMQVRRLVEAGEGRTVRITSDLMAWVHVDDEDKAHVHVGSKSRGAIVHSEKVEAEDLTLHLKIMRIKHEATLTLEVKELTVYVKDNGKNLDVAILSPFGCDCIVDEATIPHANLYEWIEHRQDW